MRRTILFIAVIIFLKAKIVTGDGFVLVPITHTGKAKVSSDAQRALLVWHEGKETLHIKSTYSGPSTDFAWVIPVPSLPTVKRSNWSLFTKAEKTTRPRLTVVTGYRIGGLKGLGIGCSAPTTEPEKETPTTSVRELESLNIRELHIDIVAADDAGGFIQWLREHEYAVDKKAEPILRKYIERRFYFVVTKIRKSSAWAKLKGVTKSVSGALTPLAITFTSKKPFYPLTISAISSAPENELILLTAAPQRLEPVEYASTELSINDIEKTIAPPLEKSGSKWFTTSLDFAPAVKAAQKRLAKPALIVECAAEMAWQGKNYSKLVKKNALFAGENVRITRFHSFLKPEEMKDINFVPAKQDKLFDGKFLIDPRSISRKQPSVNASASIMILGLISAVASKLPFRRRKNLQKLALILLLMGLVLS